MAVKNRKTPSQGRVGRPLDPQTTKPGPQAIIPKDTGEAKLLLCFLFGLSGLLATGWLTFSAPEFAQFGFFLRGQTGLDFGDMLTSGIFWKLLIGFSIGAGLGWFVAKRLKPGNIEATNKVARYGAIFLLTIIIYIPAMTAGYIWDDDQELTANPDLKDVPGLVQIWSGARAADYLPLKTTMLWVEYHIWDIVAIMTPKEWGVTPLTPVGYHVMNIIIHGLAAMLLVVALKQLGVPGAWLAGLIFAIHPVHVESVAWVSERKNTLSLIFYLLTFIAYFKFERTKNWGMYAWALLAFVAACLCKSHVVVLPVALLLCCWWKQGKLTLQDFIRSIPFFAIALGCAVITVYLQHLRAIGQEEIENFGGWGSRFAMAGMSCWWYLYKAICPDHLITIYPIWHIIPFNPWQLLYGFAMLGLFFGLLVAAVRYPKPWVRASFFALAYFLATLLPVMGFIKMSYMRVTLVADHFQYLSDISIIALYCAGIAMLYQRLQDSSRKALVGAVFAIVVTFSAYSWNRAGTFQNEETLWTDTLSKNQNTWQAHNHMGAILYMRQDYKKAIFHFRRGVELRPGNCEVQNNLGLVLAALGDLDGALIRYAEAVRIKGDDASIRTNYANGLAQAKRYAEAIEQYKVATSLPSANPAGIWFNLGNTYMLNSQYAEAADCYRQAVRIAPNAQDAQNNLRFAEAQMALHPAKAPQATPPAPSAPVQGQ